MIRNEGLPSPEFTRANPATKKGAENLADERIGFFKTQLEAVQPEVVLVLGKGTADLFLMCFLWNVQNGQK